MHTLLRDQLRRLSAALGFERDWYLVLIAAAIGILMGAVATAFILPIRAIERWSEQAEGDRTLLLVLVVAAPAVGGLLAGIASRISREQLRATGVTAVLYAVYRGQSKLPLRMALRKWIASTLTIASGGSAGAEGPIVTIGATVGSNVGQWLRSNPQITATLLGCGAAAGISSVFNAPIAGIIFVLEVILRDFSLRVFAPILIASVISAAWTQTMLGEMEPLFPVAEGFFGRTEYFTLLEAPNFFMLGLICGVVAPLFVHALFWTDRSFTALRLPQMFKPAIGGAALGLIGLAYILVMRADAVPAFFGNGYPVIAELISPQMYFADLDRGVMHPAGALMLALVLIAVLKTVATCLTIGSGGAGGLFAPSMMIGSGVGGAFGVAVYSLNWFPAASPAHYALVGMAAMIAATTHAPFTGIIIVYEITRSDQIILPLMLAAVIATIVSRLMSRDSVYTWKLTRMGLRVGPMSDLNILRRLLVRDVPLADAIVVHPNESAQRLLDLSEEHAAVDFVVTDEQDHYVGLVVGADLRTAMLEREAIPLLLIYELQRENLPTVTPDDTLDVVLDKFSRHDVHSLAVLDDPAGTHVVGLITRDRLMRRYQQVLAQE